MREAMASPDERPARAPSRSAAKPPNGNEIQERYLRRAIAEINELGDELLALGDERHVPVLGSGHPLGDVFLLKHAPIPSEIQEGVAFFGRSGQALLKSLQRLAVDPLAVYGTNCFKFGTEDPSDARRWLTRELHIVQPRLVVAMGDETVAFLTELEFPLSEPLDRARPGEVQRFTPTIDALVTPDIDASLDEQPAKTRFWNAFKTLGTWWAELPPY
jgi:uracil-DNA glycosylase